VLFLLCGTFSMVCERRGGEVDDGWKKMNGMSGI